MREENLDKIVEIIHEKAIFLLPIVNYLIEHISGNIDFEKSKIEIKENIIAFNLLSLNNSIPIQIILWLEPYRVSLFLENHEISDDYLNKSIDVERQLLFFNQIFKYKILKKVYLNKKGVEKKIIYEYPIFDEQGNIIVISDIVFNKFFMFHKLYLKETKFNSWI